MRLEQIKELRIFCKITYKINFMVIICSTTLYIILETSVCAHSF